MVVVGGRVVVVTRFVGGRGFTFGVVVVVGVLPCWLTASVVVGVGVILGVVVVGGRVVVVGAVGCPATFTVSWFLIT